MILLSKEEFIATKSSDTLALLGSGYSINSISRFGWEYIINECDSIAFNYFYKYKRIDIIPTYYLIDEHGVNPKKITPNTTAQDVIDHVRAKYLIIKNRNNPNEIVNYARDHEVFKQSGIIVNQLHKNGKYEDLDKDFYSDGVYSGKSCIFNGIHLGIWNNYKRVILYGVDLYDMRYCWMPYNEEWECVTVDGKSMHDQHPQAIAIVERMAAISQRYPGTEFCIHNPRSLLAGVLPLWNVFQ
jgi:hypothetical protein